MSGQRRTNDIAAALATEAARNDLAADRYEAMGDHANARVSRQLAVALRAAGDAYERRTSRRAALLAESSQLVELPPMPAPQPGTNGAPPHASARLTGSFGPTLALTLGSSTARVPSAAVSVNLWASRA